MAGKEVRAGKAFVEVTLRNKLQAGLEQAAKQLKAFAALTGAIGAGLTGASAAILGPIAAAVKQFSDVGDAVQKMATRTGMSAEAVSELAYAANNAGTDIETLESCLTRMQKTVVEAARGSDGAQQALARLGLSAASLASLSPDRQLEVIGDRIAGIQNPALRSAAAMEVFGKSGAQLLPLLSGGAAGLQAMRDRARALGLTISTDAANGAAMLNDALGTMWATVRGLTLNIGSALAPIVTEAANRISAVVVSITQVRAEERAAGCHGGWRGSGDWRGGDGIPDAWRSGRSGFLSCVGTGHRCGNGRIGARGNGVRDGGHPDADRALGHRACCRGRCVAVL